MTATSAPTRPVLLAPLPHSGISVAEYFSMHLMGALFPVTAGALLFGWRALAVLAAVCLFTAAFTAFWRRIGARGRQLRYAHALWLAVVLGLMLPAHLFTSARGTAGESPWLALPVAGLLLVILLWLLGGLGAARVHPVLVTYLLMVACFGELLVPHRVLQRDHLLIGDLFRGRATDRRVVRKEPWVQRRGGLEHAENAEPAAERLTHYTTGSSSPDRGWLPIQGLLRDSMPPLEDLIVGGQPSPIGTGSAVAVIMGGLFLLYRGLIDFRIPLVIVTVTFAVMLVLPIPTVITTEPTQFHWLLMRRPHIGWATAVTFVNYEIMASPLLFMAFFLATSPSIRPMARRARLIYATAAGIFCAFFQLYASVSYGPYLALLLATLLTPGLDRLFSPRPLV